MVEASRTQRVRNLQDPLVRHSGQLGCAPHLSASCGRRTPSAISACRRNVRGVMRRSSAVTSPFRTASRVSSSKRLPVGRPDQIGPMPRQRKIPAWIQSPRLVLRHRTSPLTSIALLPANRQSADSPRIPRRGHKSPPTARSGTSCTNPRLIASIGLINEGQQSYSHRARVNNKTPAVELPEGTGGRDLTSSPAHGTVGVARRHDRHRHTERAHPARKLPPQPARQVLRERREITGQDVPGSGSRDGGERIGVADHAHTGPPVASRIAGTARPDRHLRLALLVDVARETLYQQREGYTAPASRARATRPAAEASLQCDWRQSAHAWRMLPPSRSSSECQGQHDVESGPPRAPDATTTSPRSPRPRHTGRAHPAHHPIHWNGREPAPADGGRTPRRSPSTARCSIATRPSR